MKDFALCGSPAQRPPRLPEQRMSNPSPRISQVYAFLFLLVCGAKIRLRIPVIQIAPELRGAFIIAKYQLEILEYPSKKSSGLSLFRLFDLIERLDRLQRLALDCTLHPEGLRIAPVVESCNLMHTGNRAVRSTGLLGK